MAYKSIKDLREGEVFLKWSGDRLFKRNQNAIIVTTGSTGSGKSMQDLRRMELHYHKFFKKKFPDINKRIMENVFFSIDDVVNRLADKKDSLIPGEEIILEEAGAIHSSHAWQDKSSKLFNYILQSFRSRGIMLQMNLPVFTMLNKSARLLCHWHFIMININYKNKMSISKGKYLQLSQEYGKHYPKHLRMVIDHAWTPIKRYYYYLPSPELIEEYEKKKVEFVERTIMDLKVHGDKQRDKELKALGGNNKPFTERQSLIQELYHQGITRQVDLAEKIKADQSAISRSMVLMTKKYPKWREIPRKTQL